MLALGAADVLQPDLAHCGGIWEARKIAAAAEDVLRRGRAAQPYSWLLTMASMQLDFATPNFLIQEFLVDHPPEVERLFAQPFTWLPGGWVEPPTAPASASSSTGRPSTPTSNSPTAGPTSRRSGTWMGRSPIGEACMSRGGYPCWWVQSPDQFTDIVRSIAPGHLAPVDEQGRLQVNPVRFSWELGPDGAAPLAGGLDVGVIADGRLRSITGFLDFTPSPNGQ